MTAFRLSLLLPVLLLVPSSAGAQPVQAPALTATRLAAPLTLDGRLDEEVYRRVEPFAAFVQQEPHEGAPATERTEFWVFFDDAHVYIAARMWDSRPERIIADEMRRDGSNMSQNDTLAVALDTFHDQRTGFLFITNPLGALQEGLISSQRDYNGNWNGIWTPKSRRFEGGWSVEMQIPFRSLRYPAGGTQTWGINVRRVVRWKNEVTHMAGVPAAYGLLAIMRLAEAATVAGIETPRGGSGLELKPYVIGRTDTGSLRPAGDSLSADAGLDAKIGVTNGLTLDLTVNTDFAQVEDDQQQVNLTRFGLFFPEKREFFLEGQGLFLFGGTGEDTPSLFFSRRIGLAQGRPVRMLGGARLTGKVGRTSIGLLDIRTAGDDALGATAAHFDVVRVKRDVLGRSSIGAIATRRADAGGANSVYGADANLAFGLTTVHTYYAVSRTPERRGRDYSYLGRLEYNSDRYGAIYQHLVVAPNFNPEVGFLRRAAFKKNYAQVRFSPRAPGMPLVRKFSYAASLDYITGFEHALESRSATASFTTDFNNADQVQVTYQRDLEVLHEPFRIASHVSIPAAAYPFQGVTAMYTAGPTRRVRGSLTASTGSFYGGTRRGIGIGSRVAMSSRLALEPAVSSDWVLLPWGNFRLDLVSMRALYTVSPRAAISALIQYNSAIATASTNLRFQWEYRPGSDLFVVYSDGRETAAGRPGHLLNRSVIVKLTRLLRQ